MNGIIKACKWGNVFIFGMSVVLLAAALFMNFTPVQAQEKEQVSAEEPAHQEHREKSPNTKHAGIAFLAAAIATCLSSIAAGIAVSITGSAAIGAVAEKPDVMGKVLIFVALAEGIAIYGLLISIIIMTKI